MTSECLEEFEKMNTTTESIYELGDYDIFIIFSFKKKNNFKINGGG